MKHTKQVVPPHSNLTPNTSLPNRSDLSKLYNFPPGNEKIVAHKVSGSDIKQHKTPPAINRGVVSLLLTALISVAYLLVYYVYQSADANLKHPDPLYPLIRFFVTAAGVLGWIILFRILSKQFRSTETRLSAFLVVYLFYLFPALKIVYGSPLHTAIGVFFTIILWLVFNFLVVFYISWAFARQVNSSLNRVAVLAIPILILAACALLI